MKKALPVLYLLGLLVLAFLAYTWIDAMRRQAGATFVFTPMLIAATLVNLVLMLLLMGLASYLWSQPQDHRPAAWAFVLIGLLLPIFALVRFSGQISLPAPFNLYFAHLVQAFWPLALPGFVAAGAAAAGLLHLLRRPARERQPHDKPESHFPG
jgi:hypothetical protein